MPEPRQTRDIHQVASRLSKGGLAAIPTETVYGLAALATNDQAVDAVFVLKGRPSSNPLIVHLPDSSHVSDWAASVPPEAKRLMREFWPGPLTLVLPAHESVSRRITAGQSTVALRVPSHPVCAELLRTLGAALVAPSANRSNRISPTCEAHVALQFSGEDLLILEGGPCEVGLESTIVAVLPDQPPAILRPGVLTREQLGLRESPAFTSAKGEPVTVPGQHHRHYAPDSPAFWADEVALKQLGDRAEVAWIFCGDPRPVRGPSKDLGAEPGAYAQHLYATLYEMDALNPSEIRVIPPPRCEDWEAIHNRLSRLIRAG